MLHLLTTERHLMKHVEAIIVFLIVLMAASAVTQCSRTLVRTVTRSTPVWRVEQ